jgi:uncharacterized protein (TIGR02145 family)
MAPDSFFDIFLEVFASPGCVTGSPAISNTINMVVTPVLVPPVAGVMVPGLTQIQWNWNPVPGAAGYKWGETNNFAGATEMGQITTITETGLICNNPYTRYAWAYNECGYSIPVILAQTTAACASAGVPCPGTPTVTYGGQTYNTVQIGTQCWLKENLNIGTRIDGGQQQMNNNIIEKYCYNDLESNCNVYGGIYQWDEMMQFYSMPGVQGICPIGWHIPADLEWRTLTTYLGSSIAGGKMKTTGTIQAGTGMWNTPNTGATNESGFSALPGGWGDYDGTFKKMGDEAAWWSSSQDNWNTYWERIVEYSVSYVHEGVSYSNGGFSARCVKD